MKPAAVKILVELNMKNNSTISDLQFNQQHHIKIIKLDILVAAMEPHMISEKLTHSVDNLIKLDFQQASHHLLDKSDNVGKRI